MEKSIIVFIRMQQKGLSASCNMIKNESSFGFDWGVVKKNYSRHIETHYPKGIITWFVLDIVHLFETNPLLTSEFLADISGISRGDMCQFKIGAKFPIEAESIQILRGLHNFSERFYNRLPKD